MAVSIKHKFVTLIPDGPNTGVVRPSDWNDEHSITVGQDNILGRAGSGPGPAEEIPCTPAARSLLDDPSHEAQRTTLGLGSAATKDSTEFLSSSKAIDGGNF